MAGTSEFVPSVLGQREICPTVAAFEEWHAQAGHSEFTVPVAAIHRECQGKRVHGDCDSVWGFRSFPLMYSTKCSR